MIFLGVIWTLCLPFGSVPVFYDTADIKAVVNLTEDTLKDYGLPEKKVQTNRMALVCLGGCGNLCLKSGFTYMPECDKILRVELRVRLALCEADFKHSSKIFLLTVPRWYFFCGSFV